MIGFLKHWRRGDRFYHWYFRKTWTHQIILSVLAVAIALAIALTTKAEEPVDQVARLYVAIASRGYDPARAEDLRSLGNYLRSQPDLPAAIRFLLYEYEIYECRALDE